MFWKWWTLNVFTVFVLFLAQKYYNLFEYVYQQDVTYISFAIVIIYVVSVIKIGYFHIRCQKVYIEKHDIAPLWFASDAVMGLGMMGTLIGFLMVLSLAFADPDVTSIDAVKNIIAIISKGMGTALITTLIGLITSILLKYQLTQFEKHNST